MKNLAILFSLFFSISAFSSDDFFVIDNSGGMLSATELAENGELFNYANQDLVDYDTQGDFEKTLCFTGDSNKVAKLMNKLSREGQFFPEQNEKYYDEGVLSLVEISYSSPNSNESDYNTIDALLSFPDLHNHTDIFEISIRRCAE